MRARTFSVLLGTCAAALGLAGPARALVPGPPLSAVVQSSGTVDILYQGANGRLWETTFSGTSFGTPVDTGIGPISSAPSVTAGQGGDDAFFAGTDGQLWESTSTDGKTWSAMQELGMSQLGSQPTAVSWTNGAGAREVDVFWAGTDGNLDYSYLVPGSSWSAAASLGGAPLESAPTAEASPATGGTAYISAFWAGSGGALEADGTISGPATGWTGAFQIEVSTPLGSAPSVAVDSPAAHATLFWKGNGDTDLWHAENNGSSWGAGGGFGISGLAGAPFALPAGSDTDDVFWIGSDGNLYEATDTSGTLSSVIGPGSTTAAATSGTTGTTGTTGTGTTTTGSGTAPKQPTTGKGRLDVRVKILWHWRGTRTWIGAVTITGLPQRGTATVSCRGRGCPQALHRAQTFPRARLGALYARLRGVRFRPGARLRLSFRAPGQKPERVQERTRLEAKPVASLLH